MKYRKRLHPCKFRMVAPLVGAWIEMIRAIYILLVIYVAPLVGAWIEISFLEMSAIRIVVAPLVGAWIEIVMLVTLSMYGIGRSSRGSVD